MSRIDDEAVRRLSSALAQGEESAQAGEDDIAPEQIEEVRTALRAAAASEALGRSLTQSIAAYLNRPVRISSNTRDAQARPREIVTYVADAGAARWWVEFDARLAWSFADAMLGGPGNAERPKDPRRYEDLVTRVATLALREVAASVARPRPGAARPADDAWYDDAQIAGTCAVGPDAYSWRAGLAPVGRAAAPAAASVRVADAAQAFESSSITAQERVVAALSAACSSAYAAMHCSISSSQPTVLATDDARLPPAALRLALTAGGSGALVLSVPNEAVAAFASGVAGVSVPESPEPTTIVVTAAEAALRQLIRDVADSLPRLTGIPQRIVHLASDAQLARTPCVAASIVLRVAGNSATLNLIVPVWMAESA